MFAEKSKRLEEILDEMSSPEEQELSEILDEMRYLFVLRQQHKQQMQQSAPQMSPTS
jgi:hypothetical protein